MSECPELASLENGGSAALRDHVAGCAPCRIVVELLEERKRGLAARDRRHECARFEMLLAARNEGTIGGSAAALLEAHLRECADCQAVAATLPPIGERRDATALPAVSTASYALGREVARGGMGRILAAEDLRIGRPVAVKELLGNAPALAARFEREARLTARLQHPGIVPIYEIGRWPDGTPFYAMRMVEGRTLREAIRDRKTLDERLALLPAVIAAVEAVAFAHGQRIIHRDLTPNNILVGAHGDTVVIDWGLAKDLSAPTSGEDELPAGPYRDRAAADEHLTAVGAVIGTAAYMAPEQARGETVDERADVYALGAILYHVLAGEPPYVAGPSDDVVRQVQAGPPSSIGELARGAPRDLVSLVDKAMARDPSERYPNAAHLVDELRRFQTGRVVEAHVYTRGDLARRWIRAHRVGVVAGLASVVALAIAGALGLAGVLRERDRAERERAAAVEQRAAAETARANAQRASATVLEQLGRQELLAKHSDRAAALLSAAYSSGDSSVSLRFLLRSAMLEVETAPRTLIGDPRPVTEIAVDRSGTRLAVAHGAIVEQWSIADGRRLAPLAEDRAGLSEVAYAPDGRSLVTYGGDDFTRVWDADTGRLLRKIEVPGIAFALLSDDGSLVLTVARDGTATRWSTASGALVSKAQLGKVRGFRPWTGLTDYLVGLTPAGTLAMWDWQRMREPPPSRGVWHPLRRSDVARAGDRIITCDDTRAQIWDASGRQVGVIEGSIEFCALDAAGARAVISETSGREIRWDLATGARTETEVQGGTLFVPGGLLLTVDLMSGETELRDATSGTVLAAMPRMTTEALPQLVGDHLAIARSDGTVELIGIADSLRGARLLGRFVRADHPGDRVDAVVGDRVLTHHDDLATLRDVRTGLALATVTEPAAINDAGTRMVGFREGKAVVLDAAGGEELARVDVGAPADSVSIDASGDRITTCRAGESVRVWNTADGRVLATIAAGCGATLGPDGTRVLELHQFGVAKLWPVGGQAPRLLGDKVFGALWDLRGDRIATIDLGSGAAGGGSVIVTDVATGVHLLDLPAADNSMTFSLSFDRSGDLLAAGSTSGIEVWSISARRRLVSIDTQALPPSGWGVAISPDGALVETAGGVWSTADGQLLAAFAAPRERPHASRGAYGEATTGYDIGTALFSADGTMAVDFTPTSDLALHDTSLENRSPAEIADVVERRVAWQVLEGRLVAKPTAPPPTTTLRGRVTRDGRPAAGASVTAYRLGLQQVATAIASSNGDFELRGLPLGELEVGAVAAGRDAFATPVRTSLGAKSNQLALDMDLAGSVRGRVVDEHGDALAGMHVHADCPACVDDDSGDATTTADGEFEIRALSGGGAYRLRVLTSGDAAHLVAALGATPEVVVADGRTHVTGIVVRVHRP